MKTSRTGTGLAAAGLVSAMTLSACGGGGAASGDGSVELRMGYVMGDTHPMAASGVLPFIESVESATDGSVTIETFPDGQLASAGDEIKAVKENILDVTLAIAGYSPEELPLNQAWGLPLGMTAQEAAHAMWRVVHEDNVLSDEFEAAGVVPLFVIPTTPYEFSSPDKPLAGPDDIAGLRIRTPSDIGEPIIKEVGGEPVQVPTGEVYEALDRGTVDGAYYYFGSWPALSLDEVLHHTTIGLNLAIGGLQTIVMDREDWDALSEDQQQAIYEASKQATIDVTQALQDDADKLVADLTEAGTLTTYEWSDADKAEIQTKMDGVTQDWTDSVGAEGTEAIETIEAALKDARNEDAGTLPDYELP